MIGLFAKRKRTSPSGPRKNQWKGQRAGQVTARNPGSRRARIAAGRSKLVWWGGLVVGFVLIGCGTVVGSNYHAGLALQQLLEIKMVTVEGLHRIDKQQVIDLASLKPDAALHHIVTTEIKERVESHPWVQEAEVTRMPFHELQISVIERTPAVIIQAGAENFLGDKRGHVLARLGKADDDTLPMVTGIDSRRLLQGDGTVRQAIRSGIELAKLVEHTYDGRLRVNAANPSNLVASVRGVQFRFGEEAIVDQWEQFQRIKPTLETLNFDGHGDGANEVDLRYKNRIIVRERG